MPRPKLYSAEEIKERKRLRAKARYYKMREDPDKLAIYKAKCKARTRKYYHNNLKLDVDKVSNINKERNKKFRELVKNDPATHDLRLARMRQHKLGKEFTPLVQSEILEKQKHLCANNCCRKPPVEVITRTGATRKMLHFDHNDDTGQVRSFLCSSCNVGAGYYDHDPKILLGMVAYHIGWGKKLTLSHEEQEYFIKIIKGESVDSYAFGGTDHSEILEKHKSLLND